MPGPGNQKKSPNAAVTSPANDTASTASESTSSACHNFRRFLELADHKTIAQFCNWAATTRTLDYSGYEHWTKERSWE